MTTAAPTASSTGGTRITVTDLFCGAGGSSLGAEASGMELVLAANHWRTAIDVHQAHFPNAGHDCADISQADPRRYRRTDVLLASPECFPAGTLVLTKRGQVPIEQVRVGDIVLTHLGRWRPVVRTQSRYSSTVVVRGQGHAAGIEVTPNHRFWLRASKERRQRVDNRARNLWWREHGPADWTSISDAPDKQAFWATPVAYEATMPQWPVPIGQDDGAWWVVGRWLGDGSLTFGRNHEVLISCGNHEADELEDRLAATALAWARDQKRTAVVFRASHAGLRDWLFEQFGHGSGHKQLPGWVYGLTPEQRTELLDGYVSADGHTGERRTRIDTVSKALAVGVRLLAESLGYRAGLYRYDQHATTIEGRSINVLPIWAVAWENNQTSRYAFVDGEHAWSRVRSVAAGRAHVEVFNIEVQEDHSYVADGIVVANCTNHSRAKGVSRKSQDPTLWDEADAAAERSRATMWDVGRFAEQLHYDAIVVENVVEATRWSGFPHWLGWLTSLGYEHRILSHNSMHHGVPQSRNRMYVVLWRKGLRPDLEMELSAYCSRCDAPRTVRQAWKNGRTVGLYRQQWIWACTTCGTTCEPAAPGAETIIDWDMPCPRIGDRVTKRGKPNPLSPATRARILAGLQRHGWVPVTTAGAGNVHERTPGNRARPLDMPLPVQCATSQTALALPPGSPFLVQPHHSGSDACRVRGVGEPTWTVTAGRDTPALVITNDHQNRARTPSEPLATCTTGNRHALLMRNHKGGAEMTTPVTEPARTMTTRGHQSLLVPEPAVVDVDRVIDDCGFRMLTPTEVAAAMAFPGGYIPTDLTKTAQLALAGNAVTPPVMQWITGRLAQALEAAAA